MYNQLAHRAEATGVEWEQKKTVIKLFIMTLFIRIPGNF